MIKGKINSSFNTDDENGLKDWTSGRSWALKGDKYGSRSKLNGPIDQGFLRESYFQNYSGNQLLNMMKEKSIETEKYGKQSMWDVFEYNTQKKEDIGNMSQLITAKKVLKIIVSIVMLLAVITLMLISKSCLFLITSNIYEAIQISCNTKPGNQLNCWRVSPSFDNKTTLQLSTGTQVKWIWSLVIVVCTPYIMISLRCLWRVCFKKNEKPKITVFFIVFLIETFQCVGMAIFVFKVLPNIDSLKGECLMFGSAFIPAILKSIDKDNESGKPTYKIVIDVLAVIAQASIFVVWSIVIWNSGQENLALYIPISLILISLSWWENYVSEFICLGNKATKYLLELTSSIRAAHTLIYLWIGIWKCVLIISCVSVMMSDGDIGCLKLLYFQEPETFSCSMFSNPAFNITRISYNDDDFSSPYWIAIIQVASCLICYIAARNACKIMLQITSFSIPLVISSPLIIAFFLGNCEYWNTDNKFNLLDPKVMFWTCDVPSNSTSYTYNLIMEYYLPIVLAWWLSYMWVTSHIWYPNVEKLVQTERLFVKTYFCDVFLQFSLTLNRRNDEHDTRKKRNMGSRQAFLPNVINRNIDHSLIESQMAPNVPKIFVCATMWHENEREMRSILTSILRLDLDQAVRHHIQYFDVVDPDFYEFEAHIFFDDAFDSIGYSNDDTKVNSYVKALIKEMNAALNNVHNFQLVLNPPQLYNTPYGGKLEWIMPGNNKLFVHLKDKQKIRHRKRWSQVMYMYYFLGYQILGSGFSAKRKQIIADNTFLLALDGDVDFKPESLQLLVDRMKKDIKVGAACGRITPRGSGPLIWYQQFEYSISHWLQKATEHVIGCVLCSPGCFSLFRASALMDDNVIRKYTIPASEARHFVQYDQGEDRWLCTLLLQQGYRVEYCAASDASTFAPESFNEFFNQRRRWIPSTMANVLDVLQNWRTVIKKNEDISALYIFYQSLLFLLTLLTPGTIFLLIVGAISTAFPSITLIDSFIINILPIFIFVFICMYFTTAAQLFAGAIFTCIYTLLMILVVIGLILQMSNEGLCSPTTIFFLFLIGIFIFAGLLHPLEFKNIIHGPVYLLTAPSSGMLMIVYALCNMNKINWGTRESYYKTEEEKVMSERKSKLDQDKTWWSFLRRNKNKPFKFGNIFKCMCCEKAATIANNIKLDTVLNKLDIIERRLDGDYNKGAYVEETVVGSVIARDEHSRKGSCARLSHHERKVSFAAKSNLSESDTESSLGEISSTSAERFRVFSWQDDLHDVSRNICDLEKKEEDFWLELISKYLHPIEKNEEKEIKDEENLNALRNKVCLLFFLCNGAFIIVIFTLQFINERSFDDNSSGLYIPLSCHSKAGLQLKIEPLSMLFMLGFGVILLIQFSAMVYHRLATLLHIIASTNINCMRLNQTEVSYLKIYDKMGLVNEMINQRGDDRKSIISEDSFDTIISNATLKDHHHQVLKLAKQKRMRKPISSLADNFFRSFLRLARDLNNDSITENDGLTDDQKTKSTTSLKLTRKKSMNAISEFKGQNKHIVLNKVDRVVDMIRQKELSKSNSNHVLSPSTHQSNVHISNFNKDLLENVSHNTESVHHHITNCNTRANIENIDEEDGSFQNISLVDEENDTVLGQTQVHPENSNGELVKDDSSPDQKRNAVPPQRKTNLVSRGGTKLMNLANYNVLNNDIYLPDVSDSNKTSHRTVELSELQIDSSKL